MQMAARLAVTFFRRDLRSRLGVPKMEPRLAMSVCNVGETEAQAWCARRALEAPLGGNAARFAGLLRASLSSRRRERRDDYEVNIPVSCSEL
jgi:hypothetical protein